MPLNLIFSTPPRLFSVNTTKTEPAVLPGFIRVYTAKIEAYDMPDNPGDDTDNLEFGLLIAEGERSPEMARTLIRLAKALSEPGNMRILQRQAGY